MNAITLTNGSLPTEIISEYIALENRMKADKARMDEIKTALLTAMEENNVVKIDTNEIKVSYIAPTDRETFDSKQFKLDYPDLADSYTKLTRTSASLRVTIK